MSRVGVLQDNLNIEKLQLRFVETFFRVTSDSDLLIELGCDVKTSDQITPPPTDLKR